MPLACMRAFIPCLVPCSAYNAPYAGKVSDRPLTATLTAYVATLALIGPTPVPVQPAPFAGFASVDADVAMAPAAPELDAFVASAPVAPATQDLVEPAASGRSSHLDSCPALLPRLLLHRPPGTHRLTKPEWRSRLLDFHAGRCSFRVPPVASQPLRVTPNRRFRLPSKTAARSVQPGWSAKESSPQPAQPLSPAPWPLCRRTPLPSGPLVPNGHVPQFFSPTLQEACRPFQCALSAPKLSHTPSRPPRRQILMPQSCPWMGSGLSTPSDAWQCSAVFPACPVLTPVSLSCGSFTRHPLGLCETRRAQAASRIRLFFLLEYTRHYRYYRGLSHVQEHTQASAS